MTIHVAKRLITVPMFALLLPGQNAGAGPVVGADPRSARIASMLAAYHEAGMFNGSALVYSEGRILFSGTYGVADVRTQTPVNEDTIFRAGSISKQFTAAAVMALAEDGRLTPASYVADLLPGWPAQNLEKDGIRLQVHHLLTHTGGVSNFSRDLRQQFWTRSFTMDELMADLSQQPLQQTPGAKYEYSNSGYNLLAWIVHRLTGNYEHFLRTRVLQRAGMNDSGLSANAAQIGRSARGLYKAGNKHLDSADDFRLRDPDISLAPGSGALFTTTHDLLSWHKALHGNTVLTAASKQAMFTPEPNGSDYGYGFVIEEFTHSGETTRWQWHNGFLVPLGMTAEFFRSDDTDTAIILLTNVGDDWSDTGTLSRKLREVVVTGHATIPPLPRLTNAWLEKSVGTYVMTDGAKFRLTRTDAATGVVADDMALFLVDEAGLVGSVMLAPRVNGQGELFFTLPFGLGDAFIPPRYIEKVVIRHDPAVLNFSLDDNSLLSGTREQ
jgi:CubicO group peptidase (beta-lactamase class C family)